MVDISRIDENTKTVYYDNHTSVDHKKFMETFIDFFKGRIAGETLVPTDMEHFMRRTSGKNLSLLIRSKKMEGYMEGSLDKILSKRQMIAIGTVITIIFVGIVVYIILKNQGMLPF